MYFSTSKISIGTKASARTHLRKLEADAVHESLLSFTRRGISRKRNHLKSRNNPIFTSETVGVTYEMGQSSCFRMYVYPIFTSETGGSTYETALFSRFCMYFRPCSPLETAKSTYETEGFSRFRMYFRPRSPLETAKSTYE